MKHVSVKCLATLLMGLLWGVDYAVAWGPVAQQGITTTALQVTRRSFADAFKAGDANYEEDLLRGAKVGLDAIGIQVSITNEEQAIAAIGTEIRLLREVRDTGMGSYFAYRMGALCTIISDTFLPYGYSMQPEHDALVTRIKNDIDEHFTRYTYAPSPEGRQAIRTPEIYFKGKQIFKKDDRTIVADDYASGRGYNGLMRDGGPAYFQRAVEAVADAWFTVLTLKDVGVETPPPSPQAMAWYYVGEIAYLLQEKQNVAQAEKAYENFKQVNPDIMDAYEKIGDLFYAYNTPETVERGVQEWKIAVEGVGPGRQRVTKKLADYYIMVGDYYLNKAAQPGSEDTDLPTALDNFSKALEYDVTNESAAQKLKETNSAIFERRERHAFYLDTLAAADAVMEQAQRSAMSNDFSGGIAIYSKAADMYEVVAEKQDEFSDLKKTAKERVKEIKKNVRDIITKVLETAQGTLDSGDKAIEQHNYDAGINAYSMVESIVSVIPEDDAMAAEKKNMIETAQKKVDEAKRAQERYRQEQEQAQAGKAAG